MVESKNKNIHLVSNSPRRLEILEKHGYNVFVDTPNNVIEVSMGNPGFESPVDVVIHNAKIKVKSIDHKSNKLYLGSDTIVVLDKTQFGKPSDLEEAKQYLSKLSGKTHFVYSSYFIKVNDTTIQGYDRSEVTFKELSSAQIEEYVEAIHVLDKAGAYAIQNGGEKIVSSLKGSFFNVMGLPIEKIIDEKFFK